MVFLCHAIPLRADLSFLLVAVSQFGALGVPIFFTLSAYLITELLLREKQRSGTVDVRSFYLRRMLRIWPLYFLALAICYLASNHAHLKNVQPMSAGALIANVLLLGNWFAIKHGQLPLGFGPLWSLSVEEQFYLVWPWLVSYAAGKALWSGSIFVWIGSQAVLFVLCAKGVPVFPGVWLNTIPHLQFFAIGTIISLALRGSIPNYDWRRRSVMIALGLSAIFSANFVLRAFISDTASVSHTFPGYFVTSLGAALLLLAFLGMRLPRVMDPIVWLGKISYGLYVYHAPCLLLTFVILARIAHAKHELSVGSTVILSFAIGLPLTIAIATLSYRLFETPFLRLKERFELVESRAV